MSELESINHCVEALCLNGCDTVRATISALEMGLPVAQTEGLSEEARAAVLRELHAIMSCYDHRYPERRSQVG